MPEPVWTVWIVDLESSRDIRGTARAAADRALARAIQATVKRFPKAFRLAPQVLRGDELQAVLKPDADPLMALTYLRARFAAEVGRQPALRAGIGAGTVRRLSPKGPFASDGEAFHRARAAIESVSRGRGGGLTAWRSGREEPDALAEAMLPLLDVLFRRWTQPQWRAIAGRLEGRGLDAIARAGRVRFQAVSKRLKVASWNEVVGAVRFLERRMRPAFPHRRAQRDEVETRASTSRG
jgi:hypothetical protein